MPDSPSNEPAGLAPASDTPALAGPRAGKCRFAFVLLNDFTLVAFAAFVDVLRLVSDSGDRSGRVRCDWALLTEHGGPVRASCGAQIVPDGGFGDAPDYDYVVVVGGLLGGRNRASRATLAFLARCAARGATVVGLCTGSFAMLEAGLLDGRPICVSWFHAQDLLEAFPAIDPRQIVSDRLFVADGDRITCAGGRASADVAATILRRHVDAFVVDKALRILQIAHPDDANAPQAHGGRLPERCHPKVKRAALIIEQHIATGISPAQLAERLDLSVRHLERLFKESTGMGPRAYCKQMRLQFAAWLLARTDKPVADIAVRCGFPGGSHLSREFRAHFGLPPVRYRAQGAQRAQDAGGAPVAHDWRDVYPDRIEFY
ncbi:GlxA family transcriptional regulator [Burkholderia sp. Ac-20379]|uniref:GlxA family transcriptional regulator n=1 Tax=Burkholderia sp. Ac-20379 TaxID=2703900 RepID=UPI00197D786F|nr:GlxA family transcriptional regulator [Burkholderia sp. Ac-20379]MBN3725945.1 GlxA family transcriptional regulator [Burkholderia sp. Ac-20379]